MTVVLLRHGETEWSLSGQHTGATDIGLTEHGRAQAREARARLPITEFAHVLASPRTRAQHTARLAGLEITGTDGDLAEWDYGDYEGLTSAEIQRDRPDWFLWTDGCPGGESPDQVRLRVDRLLDYVRSLEGDVCLVAHGHVLRAIGARWLRRPIDLGGQLKLGTAAVCVLGGEHHRPALDHWNLT